MNKKIYYCIAITHFACNLYGTLDNRNTEKLENPDLTPIINILVSTPLDNTDNVTIENTTLHSACSAPFSIQNYIDLYGPFTMATANNGQILDFNKDNITSLYGLQNITNYDVVAVRLIGNCITGNTVDQSFPDTPFQGLPHTQEVRLNQNNIESLPVTFLSGLDQLAYVILGNNQLSNFPENFFKGHDLIYLGIANNKLTSLDTVDIHNMPSLQNFIVNNNAITSIPVDYFKNNPILTIIYLNKNSLTDWPATTLNYNSFLAYLDLSYNFLSDFQPDYIHENSTIALTGNPINTSTQDEIQSKYSQVNFIF